MPRPRRRLPVAAVLSAIAFLTIIHACQDPRQPLTILEMESPQFSIGSGVNEPADLSQITDRPWDALGAGEGGWSDASDLDYSLVSDSQAPTSPTSVGEMRFPVGFSGGVPAWSERMMTDSAYVRLYVSFWLKVSPDWQGAPTGINLIGYFRMHGSWLAAPAYMGANSNPLTTQVRVGGAAAGGARNLVANVNDVVIARGDWVHWEVLLVSNTEGNADGKVHWWINGLKAGEYVDLLFADVTQLHAWEALSWRPEWAGQGTVAATGMYMRMDHYYASGSATYAGTPGTVSDLTVDAVTDSSATLAFTEVDDGTGQPAKYDIRYAVAPISWGSAPSVTDGTCATPVNGTAIGALRTCTVLGLSPTTNYEFQLVAYRGTLMQDAVFGDLSNIATATTSTASAPDEQETICATEAVFFCDNFEARATGLNDLGRPLYKSPGWAMSPDTLIGVATDESFDGTKSLRFRYPNDTISQVGQMDTSFPDRTEIFLRHYVRWSLNWEWSPIATKHLALMVPDTSGHPERVPWAFHSQPRTWPAVRDAAELIHAHEPEPFQEFEQNVGTPVTVSNGAWYCLELHVKMVPGEANDVLEGWIDGVLKYSYTTATLDAVAPDRGWTTLLLSGWWNEPQHRPPGMVRWFDNIVMSSEPIGCL